MQYLFSNIDAVGGALGLYITFTGNPRQFQFQDNRAYYYIALGLMLAAIQMLPFALFVDQPRRFRRIDHGEIVDAEPGGIALHREQGQPVLLAR